MTFSRASDYADVYSPWAVPGPLADHAPEARRRSFSSLMFTDFTPSFERRPTRVARSRPYRPVLPTVRAAGRGQRGRALLP